MLAAGWREQEIAAAPVDLADNHMLTLDSNEEIKEATKSAISKLGALRRYLQPYVELTLSTSRNRISALVAVAYGRFSE